MTFEKTLGRRLAKAMALMTLTAAGLTFGVSSGASLGLRLQGVTDGQQGADLTVGKSDSVDPVTVGTKFDNNSASQSTDVVSPKEDPPPHGQLTVIDHVVNDNGGTAAAGDFDIVVDGAQASPSMFKGDAEGTSVSIEPGDYKVSLEDGP